MKTLCLYYSRTGTTKQIMENIAKLIGADTAEYTDGKDRSGFFGYIGACFATVKNTMPRVYIKGEADLKAYDRLIIGMPIWAEGPCAVGRAFVKKYGKDMPADVYFVVTQMGTRDYSDKIKSLDELMGKTSSGQVSIRTKYRDYIKASSDFAAGL